MENRFGETVNPPPSPPKPPKIPLLFRSLCAPVRTSPGAVKGGAALRTPKLERRGACRKPTKHNLRLLLPSCSV